MSVQPTHQEVLKKLAMKSRADNSLKESEEKYRELFENEPDAVVVFDDETGRFENANKSALNLYEYSKDEFLALTVESISPEKEKIRTAVQKIKDGSPCNPSELVRFFQKKSGTIFPCEIAPGMFTSGGRKKIIWAVRNISDRMQMEAQLRESEAKYRKIFETIQDVFFQTDFDGNIIEISPSIERYTGLTRKEFIGQPVVKLYHNPKDREKLLEAMLKTGELNDYEIRFKSKNNRLVYGSLNLHKLYDSEGIAIGREGTVRDITERKRAEEQIRNLSSQILNAHEEERQMISRELHDSVAQDLSTLKITLEMLFDKRSQLPRDTIQKLSALSKILTRSIAKVRNLSYELRPPGLKEFGLVQTLSAYCEEFSKNTGVTVEFRPAGLKTITMNSFIEINVYRLIQEGLNNVLKHAEADRVIVKLVGAYPDIILRIEDNGKGFDVQTRMPVLVRERRMGLRTMRERVDLLQGTMTIQSGSVKGTQIFVKFPLKDVKHAPEKTNHHY